MSIHACTKKKEKQHFKNSSQLVEKDSRAKIGEVQGEENLSVLLAEVKRR